MTGNSPIPRLLAWLAALAFLTPALHAQNATQNIPLAIGWNAVWLEVEPVYAAGDTSVTAPSPLAANDIRIGLPKDPRDVFTNSAIQKIASPKPLAGLSEVFGYTSGSAPDSAPGSYNQDGWEYWSKTDPANASNLVMTTGNRGYLIESSAVITNLNIKGKARFFRPKWTPDRYNLVGFGIDGAVPFADFFASAPKTHPLAKIYTLNTNGTWVVATGNITDGKAYWIFSAGPSDFMGPVSVDFDNAITGSLNFGGPEDAQSIRDTAPATTVAGSYDIEEVVFTNRSTTGVMPSLTLIDDPLVSTDGQIVLTETLPDPAAFTRRKGTDIGASHTVAEMPAGTSILSLGASASRQWALPAERTNLYRLKTGGGNAVYLPVRASNTSLPALPNTAPTASTSVGLWVGEVSIDAVTSVVENGEPVRPSAGSAPIRVILHSDAAGGVRLLSQVTVMQTKTADPEIEPTPVLVVDPAQIPFFEGIKERNGKRVGIRIESVAYDMPRMFDAASQAALLADAAYPDLVDEAGIPAFLDGRTTRPPSLQEEYHLSWPLTGEIGSGKTVTTTTPLTLDPFHRSNPFRHAFHKQHARGPNITRTITIVFDPNQTIPGRLSGTFTDSLQGLTTTDLTLTGRIEMRRVSAVLSLEGAE
jgi:hypothetical protein